MLVKDGATTGLALLTLALGIGATTTFFSLVDALYLRPLPVPGAERIVRVNAPGRPHRRRLSAARLDTPPIIV
jgi:putative ABC transport system permease protein